MIVGPTAKRVDAMRWPALALVLWAFGSYCASLFAGIVHDDVVNAMWMQDYSALSIFAPRTFSGAWARPFSNMLWIAVRLPGASGAPGVYDAHTIHFFNVAAHVLTVCLTHALARLLLRSPRAALFAGLWFSLVPMHYQAIVWAGSVYHPVMAACGLAGLVAAVRAIDLQRARLYWLAVALLCMASLSHDAGALFAIALSIILPVKFGWARRSLWMAKAAMALMACGLAVGSLRAWFSMATQPASSQFVIRPLHEVFSNVVIFLQGAIWPVVAAARYWVGLSPNAAAAIVMFALGAVALGIVLVRSRRRTAGAFAASAALLAVFSAPALLLLDADYVRFGPRLLYAPMIWASMLAGGCLSLLWNRGRAFRLGVTALLVCMVAFVWQFLAPLHAENLRIKHAFLDIKTLQSRLPQGSNVLYVNLPWWNAPANPAFWLGAEGMPIFQHAGSDAEAWAGVNTGLWFKSDYVVHQSSIRAGGKWVYGNPGPDYDDSALRARVLDSAAWPVALIRFQYDEPGLRAQPLGTVAKSVPADLADASTFKFETGSIRMSAPGISTCNRDKGFLRARVAWRIDSKPGSDVAVFVHAFNDEDVQVFGADGDPLGGSVPLSMFPAGARVDEQREIRIPGGADVSYIKIGLYERASGKRIPVFDPGGQRHEQDAVVSTWEPCGP